MAWLADGDPQVERTDELTEEKQPQADAPNYTEPSPVQKQPQADVDFAAQRQDSFGERSLLGYGTPCCFGLR